MACVGRDRRTAQLMELIELAASILALLFLGTVLIVPIVALVKAAKASREIVRLHEQVQQLQLQIFQLSQVISQAPRITEDIAPTTTASATESPPQPMATAPPDVTESGAYAPTNALPAEHAASPPRAMMYLRASLRTHSYRQLPLARRTDWRHLVYPNRSRRVRTRSSVLLQVRRRQRLDRPLGTRCTRCVRRRCGSGAR